MPTDAERVGRKMPQPGERWRLRIRLSNEVSTRPCGCGHEEVEAFILARKPQIEGRVFTILPLLGFAICGVCEKSYPVGADAGVIAIAVPEEIASSSGKVSLPGWLVPYTWLEPEDWRGVCEPPDCHHR